MKIDYGSAVRAPYVLPDPARPGHYVAEMRPGIVTDFSHYDCFKRGWGWAGDMLVKFEDGHSVWIPAARTQDDEEDHPPACRCETCRFFGA